MKKIKLLIIKLARKGIIKLSDKKFLDICFQYYLGRKINWDNPKTYNEKLQWLKVYDRKDIYTMMVDKYEAKKYVATIIGDEYIIPTLGVYENFDDIDFSKLPNKFVMKCTHDSGGLVICTNKKNFDYRKARKKIENSLKVNYYNCWREWPYKNVKPRIIIEKYLKSDNSTGLDDYKFFCFNGEVKLLFVATDRMNTKEETKFDFFDANYNHLPIRNGHPNSKSIPPKPKKFEEMKRIASLLSQGIPHLRVDLYESNGKIYFGELTFSHWAGMVPFDPKTYDELLGSWIDIKNIRKEGE